MKYTLVLFITALMSLLIVGVAVIGPEITAWLQVAR